MQGLAVDKGCLENFSLGCCFQCERHWTSLPVRLLLMPIACTQAGFYRVGLSDFELTLMLDHHLVHYLQFWFSAIALELYCFIMM